jgi:DNA polymerase-3 subunit alpha
VLEPNENSLNGTAIRFGFSAIKNVGTAAIENTIKSREAGSFASFTDFLQRTDSRKINKKVLESLIRVGAMDRFSTRASMLDQLEEIRAQAGTFGGDEGQDSLFMNVGSDASTHAKDTFKRLPDYPQAELLSFEKDLLGFYLTQHPMAEALEAVSKVVSNKIDELEPTLHNEKQATLGGIVTSLRFVKTKAKGEDMCFGTLDDGSGTIDFVLFPKAFKEYGKAIILDNVLIMKGKLSLREEKLSLQVDKAKPPEVNSGPIEVVGNKLTIPRGTPKEILQAIGKYLKSVPGDDELTVIIPNGAIDTTMKLPYTMRWDDETRTKVDLMLKNLQI